MAKGHIKGPVAEREVAGLIKPWWRQLEPEALFVRTPLSGGWHDEEHRKDFKATGDIMTSALKWPFDIEVKRREGWSEPEFVAGRPSPVWQWWRQCQISAWPNRNEPMLWLRRNRRPWVVLLRVTFVESLFKGRAVDQLPPTLCSQCIKPIAGGCVCVHPRPGSGCLGRPLYTWADLNAVHYGPSMPMAFYASELLLVHPSRFVKGHPACPTAPPAQCPMCGAVTRTVRGAGPSTRRCAQRCGWGFNVEEHPVGWLS